MRALRVALIYNLKTNVRVGQDAPPDALAEYDAPQTVEGLTAALEGAGHQVIPLEADETLIDTVRQARPDLCFNIAEGLRGDAREAQVPALLELLGIPYTGSKVLAQALSLDKAMTKRVWRDHGLPTAPFQVFARGDEPLDPRLTFPLFVKPVREGSGMGITPESRVFDEAALRAQVRRVIRAYRQPALVETFLPGREFTVGLIGNTLAPGEAPLSPLYDARGFHVFPVEEIDLNQGATPLVYNTAAKSYGPEDEGVPGLIVPADIPAPLAQELKELAVAAFEALGALDLSRVDFRLDAAGRPNLVEINTLPGLRPAYSDMCLVALGEGMPYEVLINEIVRLAARRYGLL